MSNQHQYNTTLSYLLTLDEFRSSIPDIYKPSWVKLTTITMISNFDKHIDMEKIRHAFEKYPQLSLVKLGLKDIRYHSNQQPFITRLHWYIKIFIVLNQ